MTTAEIDPAALERIEKKLDYLLAVVNAMQQIDQRERETWRDVLYRILTTGAGLIKPKHNRPPTGDDADERTPPHIS